MRAKWCGKGRNNMMRSTNNDTRFSLEAEKLNTVALARFTNLADDKNRFNGFLVSR